jgi:hypothetical protein
VCLRAPPTDQPIISGFSPNNVPTRISRVESFDFHDQDFVGNHLTQELNDLRKRSVPLLPIPAETHRDILTTSNRFQVFPKALSGYYQGTFDFQRSEELTFLAKV